MRKRILCSAHVALIQKCEAFDDIIAIVSGLPTSKIEASGIRIFFSLRGHISPETAQVEDALELCMAWPDGGVHQWRSLRFGSYMDPV